MKKFFKGVFITILVLAVIYLILCLIGPKENFMERSITIAAPQDFVMQKLGDYKYFNDNWSPWAERDTTAKTSYEGEAGKPGHKYTWDGNDEVGAGSMVIDSVTPNSSYQSLFFVRPYESNAKVWLTTAPESDSTKVTWGFRSENPFLAKGMMVFMSMEKMLAPDFEKGLEKMKAAMERDFASAPKTDYTINEIEWQEKSYIGKRAVVKFQDIGTYFSTNLPAAFAEAEKNKLQIVGAPSGLFWSYDEKKMESDMAAAIPVANPPKQLKGWEIINVPAGKALVVDYYGAYDKSMPAYYAVDKFMKEKSMENSMVIEEYVTDPGKEPDTTKWLTKIYFILK